MPDIPQQPTPISPPASTQSRYVENTPGEGFFSKLSSFVSRPVFSIVTSIILIGMIIGVLIYYKVFDIQKLFNLNFKRDQTHNSSNLTSNEQQVPYQIISQDPKDKVGRTVVYKNRVWVQDRMRTVTEGLGWKYEEFSGSNKYKYRYKYGLTGYYMGMEKISGSKDKYMIVKIPEYSDRLKVRLLFEPLDVKYGTRSAEFQTELYVENLNIVVRKEEPGVRAQEGVDRISFLYRISDSDMERLFKNNDVVSVVFVSQGNNSTDLLFDENENLITNYVSIRRFNGYNQVQNEIIHNYQ